MAFQMDGVFYVHFLLNKLFYALKSFLKNDFATNKDHYVHKFFLHGLMLSFCTVISCVYS